MPELKRHLGLFQLTMYGAVVKITQFEKKQYFSYLQH